MAGSMSLASLVTDLQESLNDASSVFTAPSGADFKRHIYHAVDDFRRVRPLVLSAAITLAADQDEYVAPSDAVSAHSLHWGYARRRDLKPWSNAWVGKMPRFSIIGPAGSRTMIFDPAPSAHQIAVLGAHCPFRYFAAHKVDATAANTTIRPEDRSLLLLRAQAEAMKDLAMRGSKKPVSLRDGLNASPRNATPAALHAQLMDEFEAMAC